MILFKYLDWGTGTAIQDHLTHGYRLTSFRGHNLYQIPHILVNTWCHVSNGKLTPVGASFDMMTMKSCIICFIPEREYSMREDLEQPLWSWQLEWSNDKSFIRFHLPRIRTRSAWRRPRRWRATWTPGWKYWAHRWRPAGHRETVIGVIAEFVQNINSEI